MKKKIAIILFNKQLHENLYIFLMPRLGLASIISNKINYCLGIKYILLNNKHLLLKTTNIFYLILPHKLELRKILLLNLKTFFGFKFKNLYFSSLTVKRFNYITNFCSNNFLVTLKKIYFYFFHFIFAFKKAITHLK